MLKEAYLVFALTSQDIYEYNRIKDSLCQATKNDDATQVTYILEDTYLPFKNAIYSRVTCEYTALDAFAAKNKAYNVLKIYEKLLGRKFV